MRRALGCPAASAEIWRSQGSHHRFGHRQIGKRVGVDACISSIWPAGILHARNYASTPKHFHPKTAGTERSAGLRVDSSTSCWKVRFARQPSREPPVNARPNPSQSGTPTLQMNIGRLSTSPRDHGNGSNVGGAFPKPPSPKLGNRYADALRAAAMSMLAAKPWRSSI